MFNCTERKKQQQQNNVEYIYYKLYIDFVNLVRQISHSLFNDKTIWNSILQ